MLKLFDPCISQGCFFEVKILSLRVNLYTCKYGTSCILLSKLRDNLWRLVTLIHWNLVLQSGIRVSARVLFCAHWNTRTVCSMKLNVFIRSQIIAGKEAIMLFGTCLLPFFFIVECGWLKCLSLNRYLPSANCTFLLP